MFGEFSKFDVVVVGGGHAGIEAAYAAWRLGGRVALVVMDLSQIGAMSCNPAVGGLAKGHLVREIDALGGLMGQATDSCGIQFRMLNASKGPAVRGPRAQVDRHAYAAWMVSALAGCQGLTVLSGQVVAVTTKGSRVAGVTMADGGVVAGAAVVLTTGTFLDGIIHCGLQRTPAGRFGEAASVGLGDWLKSIGLGTGRLKTGTPARLDPTSIDWSRLQVQLGDESPQCFSFRARNLNPDQIPCHITYTNQRTHEVVHRNLHESAAFSGQISGPGPRYCPSLEDKCARFPDRSRHQIFLEPEEHARRVIYPNGISTSLPADVQLEFLRTIEGLEQVRMFRPGYAIEYTYIEPHQLRPSLECRALDGLFLAGQINGTTGYEEAAGQGLLAGLNGMRFVRNQEPVWFERHEAYLGVLVDDLVTKHHIEPYRMFTSRAEHRLLLRQDNADLRLTQRGWELGLVSAEHYESFARYRSGLADLRQLLALHRFTPTNVPHEVAGLWNLDRLNSGLPALEWLERHESDPVVLNDLGVELDDALAYTELSEHERRRVMEQVSIEAKYAGYIEREERWIARRERQESELFPEWLKYEEIAGLRAEAAIKLERHRPVHAAAARRIAGVNPTDIALVQVHIHSRKNQAA